MEHAVHQQGGGRAARALRRVRWPLRALGEWWRVHVSGSVEHERVMARVWEESGLSPRYAFMTLMSAGIAVLGLLLSSPAVVIGAMLISPLMGPIIGLGFSLALFDFAEMRRALAALVLASLLAIAFTAVIVLASPLKATTAEILSRTRPNLFDLLVALFSALAGAFALIRGRGETIVGVAIATALMPPLATVGYGLATGNMAVAGGAFALFITNFVTIALSATIMARLYGFGYTLTDQQSWLQTALLLIVFVAMAIPLAYALDGIAREALITNQVRSTLTTLFGDHARVTQLEVNASRRPIEVRAVIIAPKSRAVRSPVIAHTLEVALHQPVSLQADQVLFDPASASLEQEQAALDQAQAQSASADHGRGVARMVAVAAGTDPSDVTIDPEARRATVPAAPLPGAGLATYRALEQRIDQQAAGWQVAIVPPAGLAWPAVHFADDEDTLDQAAREAVLTAAWAAQRWNIAALRVPAYADPPPAKPNLAQRRAAAVAALLQAQGIAVVALPAAGTEQTMVLTPAPPASSPPGSGPAAATVPAPAPSAGSAR